MSLTMQTSTEHEDLFGKLQGDGAQQWTTCCVQLFSGKTADLPSSCALMEVRLRDTTNTSTQNAGYYWQSHVLQCTRNEPSLPSYC